MPETMQVPKLGIEAAELLAHVGDLLVRARNRKDEMGAVNWGDLGISEIEYRMSVLWPNHQPYCAVIVEEAAPGSDLERWLNENLDSEKYPDVHIHCEW